MMTRRSMKNWFVLVALVFVMVAAVEVWGIRAGSTAPVTPKPRTLRMVMPSEPSGVDPIGLHGANILAQPLVCNVMEPLVDVGKKGEPVPRLATKWEHSPDLTKWRFYLRKGVKFHNGTDFTSRDVLEYARWLIQEGSKSLLYERTPVKDAVAVDDYTIDLIFEKPQPLLLIRGRSFLIPPVAISKANREMMKNQPIGTGPYRFVEWRRGLNIKLAKFDGYWGPKPQIDDVDIIFRGEEAVRAAALQAGEADWVYGLDIEAASSAPKVARRPSSDTVWIMFDEYIQKEFTGKEPIFADKRLRLAVDYAIDRKAVVTLFGGFVTPSLGQFASPGDFGFDPTLESRPYDLEKAKALVKEAGAVGKVVTMVAPAGRYTKDREVAEALAYMIEKTGLKVKLMVVPKAEVSKYKRTVGADRKYMADIVFTPSDTLLEVETRYGQILVQGGPNSAVNDPKTASLYKEALTETDYTKRWEKIAKAWAYVHEEVHCVPVFKLELLWGLAKNLEWNVDIDGRPFFADMRFTD